MICFGACTNQGTCVNRQGRVLSQAEWLEPETVPDAEFCRHRDGIDCEFAARNSKRKPLDAATKAMLAAGEEI